MALKQTNKNRKSNTQKPVLEQKGKTNCLQSLSTVQISIAVFVVLTIASFFI